MRPDGSYSAALQAALAAVPCEAEHAEVMRRLARGLARKLDVSVVAPALGDAGRFAPVIRIEDGSAAPLELQFSPRGQFYRTLASDGHRLLARVQDLLRERHFHFIDSAAGAEAAPTEDGEALSRWLFGA